jgi:hypothetical protein
MANCAKAASADITDALAAEFVLCDNSPCQGASVCSPYAYFLGFRANKHCVFKPLETGMTIDWKPVYHVACKCERTASLWIGCTKCPSDDGVGILEGILEVILSSMTQTSED